MDPHKRTPWRYPLRCLSCSHPYGKHFNVIFTSWVWCRVCKDRQHHHVSTEK